ncbi:hypothetical protein KSP39_PZI007101 [Platanthera zijinensis]|uniref:Phthiocerol/phthiodiolone dimycocerosyl transferase C-terminal domain-containing protein n=1 Tax=Platanthera zijinensis TaxID=2320716 RepID=A0AAP0BRQ9_9ASPA
MDTSSAAGDQLTSRPAGGTELSWCRAVPGGTGIAVLALHLSRQISLPFIRSSLRRLQLSSPLLRARLPSAASNSRPSFLISPSPSVEIELIPSDLLPQIAVASDSPPISLFHSLVEHEMNRNCWAEPSEDEPAGVLFATIYELPEPDRSLLVLRLHTGVCDRTAGVAILKELVDAVAGGVDRTALDGGEEEEEGEVLLAIEDLISKEDSWKPFWARGKDLVGYSLNGLRSSSLPFMDTGSNRKSEVVRLLMEADQTKRLLAVCNAKGIKLCAAITAAGMLATYASKNLQNNQPETYSVVTLVDCRKYLNPPLNDKHIGFYHSAILNTHTLYGVETFWETVKRCHDSYSNAKNNKKHLTDIGELNFLMCKAIENPHLTPASSLRTGLISIFEEVVDYDVILGQVQGLGVEDYIGCASVHGIGASIAVFETIRDGQLDCACVYPSPLHSRKQMLELVDDMKRILVEGSSTDDVGK